MKTFIAASGVESWNIQAMDEYQAAVKLRAQLRETGRDLPINLVWSAQ